MASQKLAPSKKSYECLNSLSAQMYIDKGKDLFSLNDMRQLNGIMLALEPKTGDTDEKNT